MRVILETAADSQAIMSLTDRIGKPPTGLGNEISVHVLLFTQETIILSHQNKLFVRCKGKYFRNKFTYRPCARNKYLILRRCGSEVGSEEPEDN